MIEGPVAQITHGYYTLKACPLQCNKRCYCTYEWLPSYVSLFLYILFLMLWNTWVWHLLDQVDCLIIISPPSCFQFNSSLLIYFTEYSWRDASFHTQPLTLDLYICIMHISSSFCCKQKSTWWSKTAYLNVCLCLCNQCVSMVTVD